MGLMKRKLRIEGMVGPGCEQKIEEMLGELKGVQNVKADYKTGRLTLVYDFVETSLEEIEPHIENSDYHLSSGFFSRIKKGLIHSTDKTARGNYHENMAQGSRLNCCTLNQNKTSRRRQKK